MAQEFDALDIAYTMRKANRSLRGCSRTTKRRLRR